MSAKPVTALLLCCIVLGFSSGHTSSWEDLILRADSLTAVGDYSPAESLYQLSVSMVEEAYGDDHPSMAVSLNGLGNLYKDMGDFGRAESLLVSALAIRLGSLGPEDPEVASNRYDLATVYLYSGRLEQAEEELKASLSAMTGVFGPEHPEVARYLHGLGAVYLHAGRYREAESLFKRALAIREASLGPGGPEVMKTLVNLGVLYGSLGRYADAEPLLTRALITAESLVGEEHPLVASVLVNLGNVYTWLGDYVNARLAFTRALRIMEMFLGPDHPDVAGCLDNLATVAGQQGILGEAQELHERALAIRERSLGPDHPEVAMSLNNLGTAYIERGEYDRAKEALQRALAIDSRALGQGHIAVAADLESIAEIALQQRDYPGADSLYEQALAIKRAATGSQSHEVARTLGYLGRLRIKQHRFDEAESLCRESLGIMERIFGDEHYSVAENLELLSEISRHQGKPPVAAELAERAVLIRRRALVENAAILSEADALTYSGLVRRSLSNYLSCYNSLAADERPKTLRPADIIFSCKGQVSDGIFERSRLIVEEPDTTTASLVEALRFARFQLAQMFVEGSGDDPESYRLTFAEMKEQVADLETALAMRSASYMTQKQYESVTAESLVSAVPDGCCLVEYVKYNHIDPVGGSSGPRYLAVVAAGDIDPAVVSLGWASDVDGLVDEYRRHMLRVSQAKSPPTPVDITEYRQIATALWELLWAPVARYTAGRQMVFVAPDGALNTVSFAGLVGYDGRFLTDDITIHYLSSGRDLVRLVGDVESGHGLLAFGDPDYDGIPRVEESKTAEELDTGSRAAAGATRSVRSGCEDLSRVKVPRLPGTRKEVKLIEDCWNRSMRQPATVCTGVDASEARLKAEAHGRRVIHLATHGYFLSDRCAGAVTGGESVAHSAFIGENPLLLSGLFLAGANRHVQGGVGPDGEDGILTAYEVAMLDLRGTDLVVLSACETGLGRVREGEGVYGLRRAFQVAGARTVVSALWPISDQATAQMASILYEKEATPIADRIRCAQRETINGLRSRGEPDHPFLWAGFVAVGAWR